MRQILNRLFGILILISASLFLASCQEGSIDDLSPKATRELPAKIVQKIKAKGMKKNAPVYFRLFKDEHVLEVWKQKDNGKFDMVQNYNICAWSGTLGAKYKQGDRQAPEGYYPIRPSQLNPASKYFLAINTGFPNAYDRANGRSGSDLMIHGACSSSGCYSMTDESVQQIYAFARDAFAGGQQEIILEALPFRMTPEKMALFAAHKDFKFWQMLREGYDSFEMTKIPPKVDFCEKKYVFNRIAESGSFNASAACPPSQPRFPELTPALASYDVKFQSSFAAASQRFEGVPFPIIMGGKSRPLDKKWKPQPVTSAPSTEALVAKAEQEAKRKAEKEEAAQLAAASAAAATAGDAVVPAVAPGDGAIVPLTQEQAVQTAASGSAIPVPTPNPRAATAELPAEPVKKKRRLWPFNGS